ncbi:hypothetical protein V6N11_057312 [Hibiscus sabdariffa]|uniref:Reverse transcriptase n=2 Tax=Hibiscus sabdariffa TaxID=183260 RepID=A0ABR1ZDE9_9ROSI
MEDALVSRLWFDDQFGFAFAPAVGKSGGVVVIWNSVNFVMEDLHVASRFIAIVGSWVLEEWRCGVVGVYNSCMVSEQVQLWLEISSLLHLISVPWCIRGDFNIVLTGSKRRGRSSTLQDLKIISLPRGLSDYTPILLCNAYMESGPKS